MDKHEKIQSWCFCKHHFLQIAEGYFVQMYKEPTIYKYCTLKLKLQKMTYSDKYCDLCGGLGNVISEEMITQDPSTEKDDVTEPLRLLFDWFDYTNESNSAKDFISPFFVNSWLIHSRIGPRNVPVEIVYNSYHRDRGTKVPVILGYGTLSLLPGTRGILVSSDCFTEIIHWIITHMKCVIALLFQ